MLRAGSAPRCACAAAPRSKTSACLRQLLAGGFVERPEVAIPGAAEHETARGRHHPAGLRLARAIGPRPRLVRELDRLHATDLAFAVGDRDARVDRAAATRIGLTR